MLPCCNRGLCSLPCYLFGYRPLTTVTRNHISTDHKVKKRDSSQIARPNGTPSHRGQLALSMCFHLYRQTIGPSQGAVQIATNSHHRRLPGTAPMKWFRQTESVNAKCPMPNMVMTVQPQNLGRRSLSRNTAIVNRLLPA